MATAATADRDWLADQVERYAALYPNYQEYARVLGEILRGGARQLAPLAIVQTRPKSIASFAEKALRKRGAYKDPVTAFTDLCGGRLIARTRSEVDHLGGFIVGHFEIDTENSVDASDRLKTAEFGYRSVHYIVSLRSDLDYGVPIPDGIRGLKAEIQVRTVAEHAYSDFAHDLTYKGAFELPRAWQRELAGAAATLEEVDTTFSRIETGLHEYVSSYGRHMPEEEARAEMDRLTIVLEHVPENAELADRIGRLAIALGDWQGAIAVLSAFVDPEHPDSAPVAVLRSLGTALCRLHRAAPQSAELARGRRYLELAGIRGDVDALCAYAGTWKGIDDDRALEFYRRAVDLDPADPYALGNYLDLELLRNPRLAASLRPLVVRAMARCRHQIEASVNLPWALYDLGHFHLLLGEPYEAVASYAQGLTYTTAPFEAETALDSVERLGKALGDGDGIAWVRLLLLLGLASRFGSKGALERIEGLATPGARELDAPTVVVAGGTDPRVEDKIRSYAHALAIAFADFHGTVISGGTKQGISGLMGEIGSASDGRIRLVTYLPTSLPEDAEPDPAYDRRQMAGDELSPLQPLQGWIDLIHSGIPADTVRVLGINGGRIAATEYRIAVALGATVGLVAESGREAGRLLSDGTWASTRLVRLPADAETIRAFVSPRAEPLDEPLRSFVGRAIHDRYIRDQHERPDADLSLRAWASLPPDLRASNLDQADDIAAKLRHVGCYIAEDGAAGEPAQLTTDEIEALSEMEHGRWVVERLLRGWTWGERRDPEARKSPYLVSWSELPEEIRELDRQAVRRIPELLSAIGKSIRRKEPAPQ
jgi:ppGpp synthetase/RelA/SpoT-type nucleotidyltranferase